MLFPSFFDKREIRRITLFGDPDLIKLVIHELHYSDQVYVYNVFSERSENNPLSYFSIFFPINIFDNEVQIKGDTVLVCNAESDVLYNERILKNKKIKIFELSRIIDDLYMEYILYKPLYEIKRKNRNIPIVVMFLPNLRILRNRSENEEELIKNRMNTEKVRASFWNGSSSEIPEAIKRYSLDVEYARNIMENYTRHKNDDGVVRTDDKSTPYVNVANGVRKTCYQPNEYAGTVYFFGNSMIFGFCSEDKETIQSHFQRALNQFTENELSVNRLVVNYANMPSLDYFRMVPLIRSIIFQSKDIIVVSGGGDIDIARQYGFITCETQEAFNRPHDMGEVFVDTSHVNGEGNKKIAECLFETFIENDLLSGNYQNKIIPESIEEHHSERESEYKAELNSYKTMLSQTREQALGKIG